MGIPSYFSQIIRKYASILRNSSHFDSNENKLTHLYMDCNSIVYDAYHHLSGEYDKDNEGEFEKKIIHETARRIDQYITQINPTDVVYISFDGDAPAAKMDQQRNRRYKSMFLANIKYDENEEVPVVWDTCSITPGTDFMKKLNNYIYYFFGCSEMKYNVNQVIISCSDKPGEGEHKLYSHIRKNDVQHANIAVYGLDADLIMLSIFHLKYCKRIYVCREAPEFLKSSIPVDIRNDKNESYFLDINCLAESILIEMDCVESTQLRMNDYVFMCFFLGNDFLPHFVALNIRTHGMDVLIDVYRKHIGNYPDRSLISSENHEIQWKYVKLFLTELAKLEHSLIKTEYLNREKFDKRRFPETTKKDREDLVLNAPVIYRQTEKYICPTEEGWEARYYKMLFPENVDVRDVCINYLEGLEWVYKYYTEDCKHWDWRYRYNSSALLCSVCSMCSMCGVLWCSSSGSVSLCSGRSLSVLPLRSVLCSGLSFEWSYSRYFWESSPLL